MSQPDKLYPCFTCRKAGVDTQIKFGANKQMLNPDGTPHTHSNKQSEKTQHMSQAQLSASGFDARVQELRALLLEIKTLVLEIKNAK